MASRVIEVLLENGELDGVKTVYPSNVSVAATIISRADIGKVKHVELKDNPGVYILIGMEDLNTYTIYIGESDRVGGRIIEHSKDDAKNFFTEIIFFTSNAPMGTTISKSHIKYVENKLYLIATQSPNVKLTKSQTIPQKPQISRTDEAKSEEFLDNILFILKAIGYDLFVPTTTTTTLNNAIKDADSTIDSATKQRTPEYTYKVGDALGKMNILSGNYVLLKGSVLSKEYRKSADDNIKRRREDLVQRGFIVRDNETGLYRVMQDIPNKSSSAAAQLVCGGSEAGPRVWRHSNGELLKDIEGFE